MADICTHALTEMCSCLPRRPPAYVAPHVAMRGPGERLPAWKCQCDLPHYKRHHVEWECFTKAEVAAFRAQHPTIKTDAHARVLRFIESFAPRAGR